MTDPDASGNNNVLSLTGTDAGSFAIVGGKLMFTGTSPDFESKPSYSVTVNSTAGILVKSQAFTVNVTDVNEAPVISSGTTATVAENAATGTVVYTAVATDVDAGQSLSYSLSGDDASNLNINATTGEVTLKASANFEAKPSYSFSVVATDNGTGSLTATQAVTLNVTEWPLRDRYTSAGGLCQVQLRNAWRHGGRALVHPERQAGDHAV